MEGDNKQWMKGNSSFKYEQFLSLIGLDVKWCDNREILGFVFPVEQFATNHVATREDLGKVLWNVCHQPIDNGQWCQETNKNVKPNWMSSVTVFSPNSSNSIADSIVATIESLK